MSEEPLFDVEKVNEKLKNLKSLSDLTGPNGVLNDIIKSTVEKILKAEQEHHLGYPPYKKTQDDQRNSRNGFSKKTVKTSHGNLELNIPRDRDGSFEPQFIEKHQSFDPDLQKKVISLYAKGMSTRDIQKQLEDFYGTNVSPTLISTITDAVLEDAREWQQRTLETVYPVIFLDAIHYKVKQDGKVIPRAAYTALGITLEGTVEVLGVWISESEGARFWLGVLTDLKARGVQDILIACVDGLVGFPEAIENVYPKAEVQLCIVHQIRTSLRYVSSTYHKEFMKDLKPVYQASTESNALLALEKLEERWGKKYPWAVQTWRVNWSQLSTFYQYSLELRRMIYTTNAVESVHKQFRKRTKTKGFFPSDDSLLKLLYLTVLDMKGRLRAKRNWPSILGQLKIMYGERIPEVSRM